MSCKLLATLLQSQNVTIYNVRALRKVCKDVDGCIVSTVWDVKLKAFNDTDISFYNLHC